MPQAGQRLVLGGGRDGQVAQEPAGQAERDAVELHVLTIAELEEPPDGPAVGPARLRIGDPGREEFVRREAGGAAGPFEDGRERRRGDVATDRLERARSGSESAMIIYGNGLYRQQFGGLTDLARFRAWRFSMPS